MKVVASEANQRYSENSPKVMDDKSHQSVSNNIHQHQEGHENSNSPKVTVSLPKDAALKLHDLVQKQDIALLRLGIISVQFENDQIISLTQQNTENPTLHSVVESPPDTMDEDDKDENEVVDEFENEHNSYNYQLDFADAVDLEMYENLLFPDTLNLS